MQGLWKDKKKHFIKDKFRGIYNRAVKEGRDANFRWKSGSYAKDHVVVDSLDNGALWAGQVSIRIYNIHINGLWKYWGDGSMKFGQRTAHSKTRMNTRAWISQQDWEAERKTHAYEKSLAWW